MQTTIIIADDHPLFRDALNQALVALMPAAKIMTANGMDELSKTLADERDIDLILLDLSMPGVQGFSGLMYLRAQFPGIPVAIVSASDDGVTIRRAMDFGASAFIPKSLDIEVIGTAIKVVLAGDSWTPPGVDLSATEDKETANLVRRLSTLTPQQVRVLMMLSEGLLNKQIAYELSVSEATVKAHVSAILDKLGVDSRTQAVIVASKFAIGGKPPVGAA